MIPRIIHYCWFGRNPLPELAMRCIETWKKKCPDYKVIEWNEDNFDIESAPTYVKQAYEAKKYAFVSDYVRLWALVNDGGIYMDTDVELLKPIDYFLDKKAFIGFETRSRIQTCLMASVEKFTFFEELLHEYDDIEFVRPDGSYDFTTNVSRITKKCEQYGFVMNNEYQTIDGFDVYPQEYFCPKDYETKNLKLTNNSVCVHHFDGSWKSELDRLTDSLHDRFSKYMPRKVAGLMARCVASIKIEGFSAACLRIIKYICK